MKKTIITTLFGLLFLSNLYAQDCDAYIPTETGKTYMYETKNAKGAVQSYYSHKLLSKKNKEGGIHYEIIHTDFDGKNKTEILRQDTLVFFCKDNMFFVDMSAYINKDQLKSYEESQIEFTFENMGYPKNLKPGSTLNDGYINADILAGITISFRTDITNRKAVSAEDVTTAAGTFSTLKITEDLTSKIGFVTIKMSNISWIKMNIGTIKTESYDKKGKLFSTTELYSIE